MKARNSFGNVLALVVVAVGLIILVVAFFVMNYGQLIGTHKQAQTAIDAAALQAAKDIGRVVITSKDGCHFGNVGLVDGAPKGNDINNRSQLGINTILGTIRLDALIAKELGNKTMVVLAAHDLELAKQDCLTLKKKVVSALEGGSAEDINGNTFNIRQDAEAAYDSNAVRLGKGGRSGNLDIKFGYLNSSQAFSNVPVPSPKQLAQVNGANSVSAGNGTFYKAYVPVNTDVLGKQLTFAFSATAAEPSLVNESEFSESLSQQIAYVVPSVVQVTANEQVKPIAGNESRNETMQVKATAVAGGQRLPHASGSLQVAFPGGPPPAGQGPNCRSVVTIMNNSMIELKGDPSTTPPQLQGQVPDAAQLGSDSTYTGWNAPSKGNWLTAKGGSVPANANAILETSKFRGREHDDPSVVLSFLVYDWLHNMYLRPNITAVATALSADLFPTGNVSTLDKNSSFGMQAAYASVEAKYPVTFGLFNVSKAGIGDPRDLTKFTEDPNAYRRQFANVFGYVAADMTLPEAAMVVAMNEQGQVVTTNGEPGEILFEFWNSIAEMNRLSGETIKAGKEVFDLKYEKVKAIEEKLEKMSEEMQKDHATAKRLAQEFCQLEDERSQNMYILGRAMAAMLNGSSGVNVSLGMLNDRKALTALGVKRMSGLNFELAGGNFCPPAKAATKEEIMSEAPVATGQDAAVPVKDWCTPPGEDGTAPILFFIRSHETKNKAHASDCLLQPALAAGSVPQHSLNIFLFSVNGDATAGGDGGSISTIHPQLSTYGVNVLNGQLMYQNTASLVTKSPGSNLQEVWNCIARDNAANYSSGAYFANQTGEGANTTPAGQNYPALAAEWTLRCPAPVGEVPPNTPTPPTTCANKKFINVHSMATFDSNTKGSGPEIQQVTMSTDAAGNVSYFFRGEQMHFYTGNEWMDKVLYTNSFAPPPTYGGTSNDPAMVGGLYRGLVRRNTKAMSASTVDVVSNYTAADWEKYRANHLLITNTNQFANYAHKGQTARGDYLYSVYSQVVFYTLDQNSCPQLFRWSS